MNGESAIAMLRVNLDKRFFLAVGVIFLIGLMPRLYSANTVGWNWDHPGQFTLINFDEGGSCRAALDGFDYSPVVGWQTIGISSALGNPPSEGVVGNATLSKAYCHSAEHIRVARNFSAVLGALTPISKTPLINALKC